MRGCRLSWLRLWRGATQPSCASPHLSAPVPCSPRVVAGDSKLRVSQYELKTVETAAAALRRGCEALLDRAASEAPTAEGGVVEGLSVAVAVAVSWTSTVCCLWALSLRLLVLCRRLVVKHQLWRRNGNGRTVSPRLSPTNHCRCCSHDVDHCFAQQDVEQKRYGG